jgi:small-conductance mechanosensitive channel
VSDTIAVTDPSPDVDARWAAWQAKGVAHDRALRRKLTVFMPIVIIVAAALVYALLSR